MKRYAVSSFISDLAARYHCFHWPESGVTTREDVIRGMPNLDDFNVLSLPCQHPERLHWQDFSRWVVLEIDEKDCVEKAGQIQFKNGNVIFNGSPREACKFLKEREFPVPCSLKEVKVGGDWESVSTGKSGISIAGWHSKSEAGDNGFAYVHEGIAISGEHGIAISVFGDAATGDHGVSAAIYGSDASAGNFGIAIACNEFQTSKAGDGWLAIAAFGLQGGGNAIAGKDGIAFTQGALTTATVQADKGGILSMLWHDGQRWRLAVGYVGENGIQPNTPYTLTEGGEFVQAENK